MTLETTKAASPTRPPSELPAPATARGSVSPSVRRKARPCAVTVALSSLPAADRRRIAARLDEVRGLDRLMRQRGTLAEANL